MNQINWQRQLILAASLFGLAMVSYWLEFKHKPEKELAEEQQKKVFLLKDATIEEIDVSDGKKNYALGCLDLAAKLCKVGDTSKWQLHAPLQAKADDSNVNSLISSLNTLVINESIDLKEETPAKRADLLKEYGLDPASLKKGVREISVVTSSGTTVLYLGSTHPVGETIFGAAERVPAKQAPSGKIEANTIYLVPNYFKSNLDHELAYWRDKKLVSLPASEVDSFELSTPKGPIKGERKDGKWIIRHKGEELAGDNENIDALLSSLTYLVAKSFAADQKTSLAGKNALRGTSKVASITLQKKKAESEKVAPAPITLTIFAAKGKSPKFLATVSNTDPVYEVDASAKDRVAKNLKDLRLSKIIGSLDRFSAKHLEFSGKSFGATPVILTNKDGKWTGAPEMDGAKIQILMDKLSGNRIKDFLEGGDIPTGEAEGIQFALGDEQNPRKVNFAFWKKGEKLFARDLLSKRREAFLMDSSIAPDLPWDPSFFQKSAKK